MNFLGLIVRCKDEPYVTEFVKYYLDQGVDKIYIVDDNSNRQIYKDVINNNKVMIIFDKSNIIKNMSGEFNACKRVYKKVKNDFKWMIIVDMDEYITTKKNPNKTIRQELQTTFKDCMCIKIPWVMMSCNSREKNPKSLLQENIYRWNHDKRHLAKNCFNRFRCRYESIEVKCIFKPMFFNDIYMHTPLQPTQSDLKIVDSIRLMRRPLDSFYNNLREGDIQQGYLLCYHYRIVSIENCLNKIKNNFWYKKYNLGDLLSTDYPEVVDRTLQEKSLKNKK
jgi:hypothetical protein